MKDNQKGENEMLKKYAIRDREAGNIIEMFDNLIDAEEAIENYEQEDKNDGIYTPDFYEVVEL